MRKRLAIICSVLLVLFLCGLIVLDELDLESGFLLALVVVTVAILSAPLYILHELVTGQSLLAKWRGTQARPSRIEGASEVRPTQSGLLERLANNPTALDRIWTTGIYGALISSLWFVYSGALFGVTTILLVPVLLLFRTWLPHSVWKSSSWIFRGTVLGLIALELCVLGVGVDRAILYGSSGF